MTIANYINRTNVAISTIVYKKDSVAVNSKISVWCDEWQNYCKGIVHC